MNQSVPRRWRRRRVRARRSSSRPRPRRRARARDRRPSPEPARGPRSAPSGRRSPSRRHHAPHAVGSGIIACCGTTAACAQTPSRAVPRPSPATSTGRPETVPAPRRRAYAQWPVRIDAALGDIAVDRVHAGEFELHAHSSPAGCAAAPAPPPAAGRAAQTGCVDRVGGGGHADRFSRRPACP